MVMTCRHVQELRDAYLDNELSASLAAEVHAHLLQCPACQRQVEMLRACGNVIANDHTGSELGSGFANRVVAAMPDLLARKSSGLVTRRARRRRFWNVAVSASLPAAAAIIFFCVLVWPAGEFGSRETVVRGRAVEAVGADKVVDSTIDALEDTREAARDVNRVLGISMAGAREEVKRGIEQFKKNPVTITHFLLDPVMGLCDALEQAPAAGDDEEIVRF
jgi:anti-sigma factor RsiW